MPRLGWNERENLLWHCNNKNPVVSIIKKNNRLTLIKEILLVDLSLSFLFERVSSRSLLSTLTLSCLSGACGEKNPIVLNVPITQQPFLCEISCFLDKCVSHRRGTMPVLSCACKNAAHLQRLRITGHLLCITNIFKQSWHWPHFSCFLVALILLIIMPAFLHIILMRFKQQILFLCFIA